MSRFPLPREHHYRANRSSLSRQTHNEIKIERYNSNINDTLKKTRWHGDGGRSSSFYFMESRNNSDTYLASPRSESTRATASYKLTSSCSGTVLSREKSMSEFSTIPRINRQDDIIRKTWQQVYGEKNTGRVSNKGKLILKPLLKGTHELINTSRGPMLTLNWSKLYKNIDTTNDRQSRMAQRSVPNDPITNCINQDNMNQPVKKPRTRLHGECITNDKNKPLPHIIGELENEVNVPNMKINPLNGHNTNMKKINTPAGFLHASPGQT